MEKFCNKCGSKLKENQKYCTVCGHSLTNEKNSINTADKADNISKSPELAVSQDNKTMVMIIGGVVIVAIILFFLYNTMFIKNDIKNQQNVNESNLTNDSYSAGDTSSSSKVHDYIFIISDVTWEEASQQCKKKGGYLATFNSTQEFKDVINLIKNQGYDNKKFYIGGSRPSNGRDYKWLDADGNYYGAVLNSSEFWIPGDPSFADGSISEQYMMTYYYNRGDYWAWADVPNDVAGAAPDYKGKIGYICEIEK